MEPCESNLLDGIESPAQLSKFSDTQLAQLAQEVRARIIDVVSRNGGHLAPSLGVVELTLALLATFDVGHVLGVEGQALGDGQSRAGARRGREGARQNRQHEGHGQTFPARAFCRCGGIHG